MIEALRGPGSPGSLDCRVAVVVGSTRANRVCAGLASWVIRVLQPESRLAYQILDLAEIDLPFLDEPFPAAYRKYEHEHTKAWSRLVSSFDAFVFVFPQYNWGYPAPLKNALDFLYWEWEAKPAGMVTYGNRGGGKAAVQLRGVLEGLHMRIADENVELRITDSDVDGSGQLLDLDTTLAPFADSLRVLNAQLVAALSS